MRLYFIYLKGYITKYPIRLMILTFGVTIAVLFISFMGLLTDSIHETTKEKRYDKYGEFQGTAIGVSPQDVEMLESNSLITEFGYSEVVGKAIAGFEDVYLGTMDQNAMQLSRARLKEGKFPLEMDEIAIEDVVLKSIQGDINIGDNIVLNVIVTGQNEERTIEKTFKLCGIFENKSLRTHLDNSYSLGGTGPWHMAMPTLIVSEKYFDDISQDYNVQKNVLITLKNKSILQLSVPILTNTLYLPVNVAQFGQYDDMISMDNYILIVFVILLATIGIVQSFYITIQERKHQLGIFRAVGATRLQLLGIVLGEAMVISIISIPLGIILSIMVLKLSILFIENFSGQQQILIISFRTISISIMISFATVIFAALLPAKKAMQVSPMEVILGGTAVISEVEEGNIIEYSKQNKKIEITLALRNLKRHKGRSIMLAFVIMLTLFTVVFSYNYNKMLRLDLENTVQNRSTYYHRIQTLGSGSKTGIITLENGMNEEQLNLLSKISGVERVNGYKLLNSSLIGLPIYEYTNYYKDMGGIIDNDDVGNEWDDDWIKQQMNKLNPSLKPARFKVIGVSKDVLSELVPGVKVGEMDNAIIYAPLPNSSYKKVDFQDMGLKKDDAISLVYYGNKGEEGFDILELKLTNIVNILPESLSEEDIFKDGVCIIINEKYFNELTNESLYNDLYIYVDESFDYKSAVLDDEVKKIASMGRKLYVDSKLAKISEINNESNLLMLRLYATTGVFVVLTLFILSNVVISSVFSQKREFGIIRGVGIDKRRLNKVVSLEYCILSFIGGILGILLMLVFILLREIILGSTIYNYSIIEQFPWIFSILTMIITIFTSIFMSSITLKRVMRQGIIDAIRYVE